MSFLQAAILGVIQGLAEFLPVSSSGHLILGSELMGLPAPGLSFSIMVHLGTALATVVLLWREIAWLLQGLFAPGKAARGDRGRAWAIAGFIVVASVPGALLGFLAGDLIDRVFSSGGIASLGLIVTGFVLMASRTRPASAGTRSHRGARGERVGSEEPRRGGARRRESTRDGSMLGTLTLGRSIVIGLAQGVAVLPGISRSGSTITAGLLSGLSREDAARFSFLMSVPATLGAAFLEYRKISATGSPIVTGVGLLGAALAFVAGVFALATVIRLVRKGDLSKFAYYCWAAGLSSLVWLLVRG